MFPQGLQAAALPWIAPTVPSSSLFFGLLRLYFWWSKVSPPPPSTTSVPLSRLIPSVLCCRPLPFYFCFTSNISQELIQIESISFYFYFSLYLATMQRLPRVRSATRFARPPPLPRYCLSLFLTSSRLSSCVSYLSFSAQFSYLKTWGI